MPLDATSALADDLGNLKLFCEVPPPITFNNLKCINTGQVALGKEVVHCWIKMWLSYDLEGMIIKYVKKYNLKTQVYCCVVRILVVFGFF